MTFKPALHLLILAAVLISLAVTLFSSDVPGMLRGYAISVVTLLYVIAASLINGGKEK